MQDSKKIAQVLMTLSTQENAEKKVDFFFSYLKEHHLENLLPHIKKQFSFLRERYDEFNTLFIESRFELHENQIMDIKEITGADDSTLVTQKLSDEIIGSFKARYQGKMYDGSVQSTINQMKKALSV